MPCPPNRDQFATSISTGSDSTSAPVLSSMIACAADASSAPVQIAANCCPACRTEL